MGGCASQILEIVCKFSRLPLGGCGVPGTWLIYTHITGHLRSTIQDVDLDPPMVFPRCSQIETLNPSEGLQRSNRTPMCRCRAVGWGKHRKEALLQLGELLKCTDLFDWDDEVIQLGNQLKRFYLAIFWITIWGHGSKSGLVEVVEASGLIRHPANCLACIMSRHVCLLEIFLGARIWTTW
jgi:hypothetical protein